MDRIKKTEKSSENFSHKRKKSPEKKKKQDFGEELKNSINKLHLEKAKSLRVKPKDNKFSRKYHSVEQAIKNREERDEKIPVAKNEYESPQNSEGDY